MPSLTTLTFETLRDRNDTALNRAGYTPDLQVGGLRVAKRKRIDGLLSERAHIEDLATTQPQREAYGVERWHDEFVRMRDVRSDPNTSHEGEQLQWHIWGHMPNCRFKRFQELFCKPRDFIVPPFTIDAKGHVTFDIVSFESLNLRPCLVSADVVPEKIMEDLGLCDFSSVKGDPLKRLEMKREAIPRLKLVFESAVQLEHRHHRLLAVEEPSAGLRKQYEGVEGPSATALGTILYTREEQNGHGSGNGNGKPRRHDAPRPPRSLTVQHFTSVYDAHRKTAHEMQVYSRELAQITTIRQDLQQMNRRLDREWRKNTPEFQKEELRVAAKTLLGRCSAMLSTSIDPQKARACTLIAESMNLTDAQGKENPSSSMSKITAAFVSLEGRLKEMCSKGSYNFHDAFTLERTIREHERVMQSFRDAILRGSPEIMNGSPLFTDAPLLPTQIGPEVHAMKAQIGVWPDNLEQARLQPFRTYADKFRQVFTQMEAALQGRDREGAADAAVKMHVIGKFQVTRSTFAHVQEFATDAGIPVQRIRDFVQELEKLLHERELFPERVIGPYVQPFEKMEADLALIQRGLAHYAGKDLDVGSRSEVYGRLKKYLGTFDIEEIVRGLA